MLGLGLKINKATESQSHGDSLLVSNT